MYSKLLRVAILFLLFGSGIILPVKVLAYSSLTPGYSITAPPGWQTEPVDEFTLRFSPPAGDIRFMVETSKDDVTSLTGFGETAFIRLTLGAVDYQFIYQSDTTLDGEPALEMRLQILENGLPATDILAIVCVKDGWGFRITALGHNSVLDNYSADFQSFLGSFSFSSKTAFPFRDDFSGVLAGTEWFRLRADDTAFNLANNNGYLGILSEYGDLCGGYNSAKNLLLRPAPDGDFEITTSISFNPQKSGQQAGLVIYENDDAYLLLARGHSETGIVSFDMENGVASNTWQTSFDSPVTYLKIARRGNIWSGYASRDNKQWQKIYDYPNVIFTNPKVGITAFQSVEGPTVSAVFDYFGVSEVSVNQPPEASFMIDPLPPKAGDMISFASISLDPDGDTLSFQWYLDGAYLDNVGNTPLWTWDNAPAGKHTVKLIVDDGKGGVTDYSMNINLEEPGSNVTLWVSIIAAIIVLATIGLLLLKRRK